MPSFLTMSLGFSAIPADIADHSQTSTLRRTLSFDMASEKWISQSGLKKVASVGNLHFNFHDDDNEDIWRKEEEEEMEKPKLQSSDIWSSILSQKANDQQQEGSVPYVHPLVKRSASTLSDKSLEICTESLGSETGSDGFSLSASDHDETNGDADADAEVETETTVVEEVRVSAPIRCPAPVKKAVGGSPARSFPPPLPSLANRGDGSNVEMRSHRQDGRLVLEAVSVPTHACFRAERQDGRLLLTFSGQDQEDDVIGDEFDRVGDVIEEYEVPTQDCNTVVSKFMGLTRTWPRRLNKVVSALEDDDDDDDDDDEEAEEDYMEVGHALNPYVYSWRSKVGPAAVESQYGKSTAVVEVVVEGKRAGKVGEDDLIPLMFKGCNLQQQLPKKPLLMWDHRCIAT